jgi:hypothetical protein
MTNEAASVDRMLKRHTGITLILTALAIPCAGRAQSGGSGFLFHEPRLSVTLRTGWDFASAHSDLFSFTTQQLTVDRGDFSSMAAGADVAWRVWPRTSVAFSVGVARTDKNSEFRDFVDNNQLPIQQTTSFARVPVTLGIKQYLTPPGRTLGQFAWIPSRAVPFIGAGGGFMHYRFHQSGDFVDFQTMNVFTAQFTSQGWAPTGHALAGVDYSLSPELVLTAEARYVWSSAPLSQDFTGFHRLDLSGLATTAGFSIRF